MFATGETVGLAERIIDDTCLVHFYFQSIIEQTHSYMLKSSNFVPYLVIVTSYQSSQENVGRLSNIKVII